MLAFGDGSCTPSQFCLSELLGGLVVFLGPLLNYFAREIEDSLGFVFVIAANFGRGWDCVVG